MKKAYGYIQREYKVSRQKADKGSVNSDNPKLRKLTIDLGVISAKQGRECKAVMRVGTLSMSCFSLRKK
jgi:hypothetical protein